LLVRKGWVEQRVVDHLGQVGILKTGHSERLSTKVGKK